MIVVVMWETQHFCVVFHIFFTITTLIITLKSQLLSKNHAIISFKRNNKLLKRFREFGSMSESSLARLVN